MTITFPTAPTTQYIYAKLIRVLVRLGLISQNTFLHTYNKYAGKKAVILCNME